MNLLALVMSAIFYFKINRVNNVKVGDSIR